MNKVYKVVWNASLGAWVAVSELAKGKVKGSNGKVGEISIVEDSNEKSHSETINLKSLSLAVITVVAPTLTYAGTEVSGTPTKSGANITNINTCTASATTTNGVAIGCSSIAGAKDSVIADRSNPYNTSTSNSRVTFDTTSGGNTAIGTGASAGNANQGLATAIGTYATANNIAAVAIGAAALSTGNTSLSIGRQSAATADYAQAIGNVAAATGTGALAIGHSATATGYRGIAIGSPDIDNASVVAGQAGAAYQTVGQTKASGRDAIAFGGGSQSLKDEGMTIGAFSGATEQGAAVVGVRGAALGQQSLSIGNGATNVTSGTNAPIQLATSLGQGTITNKTVGSRVFNGSNTVKDTRGGTAGTLTGTVDGVAITINQAAGTGNATTGTVGAITGGSYNGQTLTAEQADALYQSLGHGGSVTLGQRAIAIGTATAALANNALALGSTSLASGEGSVAIGSGSTATKTDSVSIGRGAGSSVTSGVAIGAEAKVTGDNSIALGQKSVASAQTGSSFLTNVGATTQGTISVGDGTNNVKRRLTNLADGAVDSDGVTVAQLKQFKVITDKQGADTAAALGGGSTYNSTTGAVTTPTYNVGGTTKTNVGDAITNIDNRTTSLENQTWKLNTNSDTAAVVGKDAEVKFIDGKNIKLSRTGTSITVATADSAKFDSVNAGGTVINNNGLSFVQADGTTPVTNSPSISKTGINAGNNKISNVANGAVASGSKDAVNGGQLQGVADSVKTAIGGNTTIDATTGAITTNNIGGTNSNTIDGAITSVKSTADAAKTAVDKGINFGGTTGKNNYALGSDINVKGDSNITSTTVAGGVQLGLANNITIGSGAGTNPVTINGTAGTVSGLTNKAWSGTATTGQAATEDQLKIVSDVASNANKGWKVNTGSTTGGTVSGNASTQVSPDQEVKFIAGKNVAITQNGKDITVATSDNPNFTSVTAGNSKLDNSGLVIKDTTGGLNVSKDGVKFVDADGVTQTTNTPSLNKTGINAGNNKISNVANGAVTASSKDAVNGSQLFNTANDVKNAIGGNTTIDATTGAITTNNIGGTNSNTIDGAITSVKSTADAAKTAVDKGINFGGTTGKNNYALGSDINVKGDSNITSTTVAGGVQLGLANNITIGSGAGTNPVTINGTAGTVSGLTNKAWSGTATTGQAATEDQLKIVSDVASNANKGWKVNTGSTTGGTVSGNASTQVSPDQEVKFIAGKNVAITQNGKDITVATSDNPNFTSVTAGNSKLDNSGLVIKDTTGGLNVSKDGVKFVDADGVTQTTNTPSLNKTGINAGNNKISNVANGAVTASSKDAVNGSQLFNTANDVKNAIGGNTTIDATTGAITTNNIGGTNSNTIDGAITSVKSTADAAKTAVDKGINFGGTTGKNNYALGSDINVKGDSNITSTTVAGGVQLGLANNITIGSGAGTNPVTINGTAGTVSGLTNKAWSGTATTGQAATEDQLKIVSDVASNANKGWKVNTGSTTGGTVSGNASTQVSPDQEVKFIAGKNVAITQNGKDITVATSDNPNFTSVTAGNSKLDNSGLVIKDTTGGLNVSKDGVKFVDADGVTQTTNTPSLNKTGINAGNNKISNVANGAVTAASKDAVNGSQLFNTANDVKNAIGGNTTIDAATGAITTSNIGGTNKNTIDEAIGSVSTAAKAAKTTVTAGDNVEVTPTIDATDGHTNYEVKTAKDLKVDSVNAGGTVINNGGLSFVDSTGAAVANSPSISATGINAGNNKISNVANGAVTAASKDAVNGSQLFNTANDVKNAIGGNTTIDAATGAITTSNIGGTNKNTIDEAIGSVSTAAKAAKTTVTAGDNVEVTPTIDATDGHTNYEVKTAKDLKVDSVNAGGTVINNGGLSFVDSTGAAVANSPSISATGINAGNNKISNVANGAVTAASKDAVNGSQLFNTANDVKNAIGGNTTIDAATGAITTSNIGGTNKNTIDEAIGSVSTAAKAAKTTVTAGDNVEVTPTVDATDGHTNYEVKTAKDLKVDSVNAGGTVINNGGLSFVDSTGAAVANSPSISTTGINAGNNKISNVANGAVTAASKDAVNGSQLFNTANDVKNAIGGNTTIDAATGAITTSNIGGTNKNTIDEAIGSVSTAAKAAKTTVTAGDNVEVTPTIDATDGHTNYEVKTAKDLKVDSVNAGGTVINNGGLSFVDSTGAAVANSPSISATGINAGNNKISNVANGAVTASSKDAVNGSQLFNTANDVKNAIGGNTTIDAATGAITTSNIGGTNKNTIDEAIGSVSTAAKAAKTTVTAGDNVEVTPTVDATDGHTNYEVKTAKDLKVDSVNAGGTVINNGGLSFVDSTGAAVANSPSISATGINAGNNKISNVANGAVTAASKDAVNGSQLFNTANDVKNAIGGNTTIDAATGAITTSNIGGTNKNTIDEAIGSVSTAAKAAKTTVTAGDNVEVTPTIDATDGHTNYEVKTAKDLKVDSVNAGGTVINNGGLSFVDSTGAAVANSPSISATGINAGNNKISNVANGAVTAASKDAVNGSQLFNTANDVKNAIGGNTTIDANTGAITTNDIGGTGANTIDGAITNVKATADKGINFGGTTGKNNYALGSDINVKGDSNITSTTVAGGVQLGLGDTLNVKDAINVGSGATKVKIDGTSNTIGGLSNTTWNGTAVPGQAATEDQLAAVDTKLGTLDDAAVKYDNATTKDKVTLGGGATGTTITNVKAGEVTAASKDAVNGSQLFNTANDVKNAIGGNTTIDANTGAITTNDIGGTGANTIDGAITNVKATADKGINFGGTTGKNNYALGSDINVKGDSNITSTTVAGGVQLGLGDTLNVKDAINVGSGATKVKIDGTSNTIGGLSNTTWNGTAVPGQAATEDQLAAVDTKLGTLDDAAVKYDNATTKDKVTLGGGATGTTITNVKAGEVTAASKDAVNGSQLFNTANDVKNAIGGNTTIDANTGAITTNDIGGTGANTIDGAITNVKATADKGINFGGTTGKNNYALGSDINVKGDSNITSTTVAGGVQLGLGDTLNVKDAINVGSGATKVKIDGTSNTIGGLSNTTWNGTAVPGQAATEDQLAAVDTKLGTLDDAAVKYDNATTKDKVTLGGGATGTTITNVKAGEVTAASKDAVNGSQLFNTANDVKNAIGGNTTIDANTGAITTNDIGGTGANTIDGAITNVKATADKGINFGGTTGKNNYALGSDINVKGDSNITSTTVAGGVQLGLGDTLNVKDAINVGSGATKVKIDGTSNTIGGLSNTTWNGTAVPGQAATEDQLAAVDTKLGTLDDAAVKYDNATTKDKVTLGGGATGTTITNVKAGEVTAASKDAVNGSQLFNTANDVKNAIGGNTTIDANTGAITTNDIGGTGANTIDGAITNVKATADKGINFGGTTGKNNYALGSDINVKGDSNITSTTVAGGVQLGLGDTLNVKDAINVGSGTTKVKIDGTSNTIGGLSNTTWNGTAVPGQAATEDQLAAVDTKLGTLDDAAVKYDNATTKDKVTLGGGATGTTITNVKAGEVTAASKDAVNGSQLFNTANDVKNAIGGNTTIDANTGAITTNDIGGTGANTIDGAITNVKATADKGINFGGTTGKNNYALGSDINVKGDSNITSTTVAGGVQLGLGDTLNVKDAINVGSGTTKVKIDGTSNTIGGLSNTTWNGTAVPGQAATEDQLAAVDTKLGTLDDAAVKYDNATTKDKVTLGGGATGTTITNVKAGEVTAASKDAVNGSQLFNTANDVKNAIGGNTTIDANTGAITTNDIGGTGANTIDGAITNVKATADKGINFGGTTGKNNYALGSDINVKGDSNITSTTVAGGVQLGLGDTLNVKDAINVGSGTTKVKIDGTSNTIGGLSNTTWNGTAVPGQAATEDQLAAVDTKLGTLDDAAVKYDNATTKDKVTLGGGATGTTITNVKAGEVTAASKDAVNGSQLFNTANDVKNAIGGNTTIDANTGAITTNDIGGTGANTIDGAITNVKATADKGINFGGTTGKNNYALGSDINVKGDSNITSTTVAGGVQLGLGDTLNVKDAINVGSGTTKVKIDGTSNTIGGLSNTTWNGTAVPGQAATEDQLAAVDTKLGTLDDAAVKYDNATTKDKVTLGGGATGTTITNVKAGEVTAASKDAVNGSQLFNTANDVKNAIGGNTTIDANTGAITTNDIGGTGANTIDGAITNVKATADKGINFGGTTGKNNYALGSDINVKGDSNITSTTVAGGVQLGLGDTLNVKDAINVGSGATKVKIDGTSNTIGGLSNTTWNGTAVPGQAATEDQLAAVDTKLGTLDDAAVKYDNATTKDKVTLGGGATGTTITNVKAGEVTAASKDAVNGSQLFNTANDVKNAIGGNTTIDANTGAITTNDIGGTGANTIDGAITNVKATADKGINFGGTTGKNNYALGSDINVKGDSNITSTTVAGGVQLGLGDTLNVKDAINVGSGATKVKIDGTSNTIGGLSNTTWNGTAVPGQAATEDQLAAVDTKLGTLDDAAVKYDNATTKDKVTLGGGATGTTITNVKAGEVTAASKDAVNGSQLFNTANDVKNAIGGNTTIDANTGAITTNDIGGTGANTIDGAITNVKATADKGINFGGTTGKNNYALGSDINVKGDSNITSTTVAGGVQLGLGDTLNVKDAINVGSGTTKVKIDGTSNTIGGLSNTTWNGTAVPGQAATEDQLAAVDTKLGTLDDAAVKYDNATTKDKVTLGGGATGTTITNVKAGEVTAASKDAVNGSQLFNTANDVKNAIGGNTTIDANTGAITTNDIGGTGANTIDGAITNVKATADKGINFGGTTGKNNYALGSDINVKGDSNITSTTVAGGVQLGLGDTLNVKDAINVGSGTTKVKIDGTSNTIGGLSNTTWNGTAVPGQAATEDQLAAVDTKLGTLDDAAVKYDNATTKDKVTLGGCNRHDHHQRESG